MLNQPTSSPMITRMLGLRCCAAAGPPASARATHTANKLSHSFRMIFIVNSTDFNRRSCRRFAPASPKEFFIVAVRASAVGYQGTGILRREMIATYWTLVQYAPQLV